MRADLDHRGFHVIRIEQGRGAQRRAHGALAVGRHVDQAPSGRGPVAHHPAGEARANRLQVVDEDLAELVGADLADVDAGPAEADHAGHAVAGRPARALHRRTHARIELGGAGVVDQLHRALGQALVGEKVVGGLRDHVDQGVADGGDVVQRGHGFGGRARVEQQAHYRDCAPPHNAGPGRVVSQFPGTTPGRASVELRHPERPDADVDADVHQIVRAHAASQPSQRPQH